MALRNCTIEASVDFPCNRADALFSKLHHSVSAECGNWLKNKRKRYARDAVALGLVNDVNEFYRMFPATKKIGSKPGKGINNMSINPPEGMDDAMLRWKKWCREHSALGRPIDDNLLQITFMNTNKSEWNSEITILKKYLLLYKQRPKRKKPKRVKKAQSQLKKKCRQHQYGLHTQITKKEWGSIYRPARY